MYVDKYSFGKSRKILIFVIKVIIEVTWNTGNISFTISKSVKMYIWEAPQSSWHSTHTSSRCATCPASALVLNITIWAKMPSVNIKQSTNLIFLSKGHILDGLALSIDNTQSSTNNTLFPPTPLTWRHCSEKWTLPCEAMAHSPKSCLLLLTIVVDDDGNENAMFTSHLITIIFSKIAVWLQTCLMIGIKLFFVNRWPPVFTIHKFRKSAGLVGSCWLVWQADKHRKAQKGKNKFIVLLMMSP